MATTWEERSLSKPRPMRPSPRLLVADVRWGLGWALAMATVFSAWVLLLTAMRGSARFDTYGMTAWQIIEVYYATACVAGLILGVCRPFTQKRVGAIAVGAALGTAVYTGIGISLDGVSSSTFLLGAFVGVPMGGLAGNGHWKRHSQRHDDAAI